MEDHGEVLCPWCSLRVYPDGERIVGGRRVLTAFHHSGVPREMIIRMKFYGERKLAGPLARLALASWRRTPVPGDAIVPVPSTGGRIRTRGYNQTDLLAAQLASLTGAEVRRLLKRRGGATQIGLGAGERTRNIRGAFTAVRARRPGGSIWLLDDVMTTGATMTECASVLEAALDAGVLPAAVCFRKPEDESIIQGKEVYHGGV